ncbi:MAG: glycosyltransferase family 9 protein [Candidatus Omnitrophota bacterium]
MEPKKILVFNPFGIGDVLFSTPLIRNLKEAYPHVRLFYLCNRRVWPLLNNHPFLEKVFIFEKDEWRAVAKKSKLALFKKMCAFFNEIKKEKFDIVFDLSLNAQYGFFLKLTGIKTRIGFNFKNRGRFLNHRIDIPGGFNTKHVTRHHLELVQFLAKEPCDYRFDLFCKQNNIEAMRQLLVASGFNKNDMLVIVCPGSGDSWQRTAYFKRWPQEYFAELCRKMQKELKAKIILCGSPVEKELCDSLYAVLEEKPLLLCDKLGLDDFAALVSLSGLVITNDGGPFHITQALNKRAVVFFGPVDERVYGAYPDESKALVFTSDVSCRPCYWKFKFSGCSFDKQCLRKITVDEVFLKIKSFLAAVSG